MLASQNIASNFVLLQASCVTLGKISNTIMFPFPHTILK